MKRLFFLPSTKCHNLGLDFVLNVIKILRNDSVSRDYVHNSLYNISKEMCKTDQENVDGTLENKTNSDIIPFQELGADSTNVSTTEMRTSNEYETASSRIFQITTTMGVRADFFPSAQNFFPFSNYILFLFEPKETKIREDNVSEIQEREESSSIFVVWERIYNVKFNMNAQTWLLNHYWLFLLEYFFSSQGGPWSKRLCRPYAYVNRLG